MYNHIKPSMQYGFRDACLVLYGLFMKMLKDTLCGNKYMILNKKINIICLFLWCRQKKTHFCFSALKISNRLTRGRLLRFYFWQFSIAFEHFAYMGIVFMKNFRLFKFIRLFKYFIDDLIWALKERKSVQC